MKKLILSVLVYLIHQSAHAVAENNLFPRFNIHGSFGLSQPEDTRFEDSVSASLSIGFDLNRYISLAAGYTYLGEFDLDNEGLDELNTLLDSVDFGLNPGDSITVRDSDIEIDGFEVGGTANLPLGEFFVAYVKAGVYFWDAKIKNKIRASVAGLGTVTLSDSTSDDGSDLFYSVGGSFKTRANSDLLLEWSRYEALDDDVDTFKLGFKYNF